MAAMSNLRHLKRGEVEPPPPAQDVLRVYGMKFCPYVQRLKLVLTAKGIEHETVNINLAKKPKWFLAKNPRGKVPVIEKNGEILYESDITSEYVDEVYPGRRLRTLDPFRRAKEMIALGDFTEGMSGIYGFIQTSNDQKQNTHLIQARKGFAKFDKIMQTNAHPYLCGNQPGMTDYMIWPHLERIGATRPEILALYPAIQVYFGRMGEDDAVKACRHSDELHRQFIDGYKSRNWVYDLGTVEEYHFVSSTGGKLKSKM
ncbi:glutathione S-transferase omega-1-like [Clavelina lepadiformis]|uniref:glutathione S-transferase omega-1-like n=1 Tax=Clavelina lepadiformis TaxID=159417 RepID=UPI004040F01E